MDHDDPVAGHGERPASTSVASANIGAMPACDMFPSSFKRAPETGFPDPSLTRSVITAWPTRGGCGVTSEAIVTSTVDGLRQPTMKRHKRHKPIILFVPLRVRGINALSCYCRQRFSMQSTATRRDFFTLRRKQVVVHRDHHRDEHHRVVEKMYLDSELRKKRL